MFLSDEETSKVLKFLGISVSNDSIKRLNDKIIIEDNKDVETIGIDDVAPQKVKTLKIDSSPKELDEYDYDNSELVDENG